MSFVQKRFKLFELLFIPFILIGTFSVFALFVENSWVAVTCLIVMGFCGISLNPALVSRLMELPQGQRAFINTLHASVINVGIMFGSFAGFVCVVNNAAKSSSSIGLAVFLCNLLSICRQNTNL